MPASFDALAAEALAAHGQRDWAEAGRRWAMVREAFPDHPAGWSHGAEALREAGEFDGADRLLAAALERFGNEVEVVAQYAWIAHRRGDWAEADRRWQMLRIRFPSLAAGWALGGEALREAGRFSEAETLLVEGSVLFPDDPDIAIQLAWVAHRGGDLNRAIQRWATLRARLPEHPLPWVAGVEALRHAGRPDAAGALLEAAEMRFPEHPGLVRERQQLAEITAASAPAPAVFRARSAADEQAKALLLGFEAFGGDTTFGRVQRHFGAEPAGLLRWAQPNGSPLRWRQGSRDLANRIGAD